MRSRLTGGLCVFALLVAACAPAGSADRATADLSGQTVEILGVWQDVEAARFERVLQRFQRRTGARAVYTSTEGRDVAEVIDERLRAGTPPDLAFLPQPGLLQRYASEGVLLPIEQIAGDAVRRNWPAEWQRLATVDGVLYGVWFKAAHKSLVWYDIATFERAGVVPPSTPDDFAAVAAAVVAAGVPAFAIGGKDEWTLTDWFENLYLRLAGPSRYDALAQGRLAWTDASVVETLTVMQRLLTPPTATGGPDGVASTSFEDSVGLVFGERPARAAMAVEGDFVAGVITGSTDARLGVDADVFPFPDVDPARRLVVGGGDAAVMLRSTPASRALLADLATPAAAEVWARLGGFVSANQEVDLSIYPDGISRAIARSLIEAGDGFRFDLSDLQPAPFGATTGAGMFGILAQFVVSRADPAATALALEQAARSAYAEAVTAGATPGGSTTPRLLPVGRDRLSRPANSAAGAPSW